MNKPYQYPVFQKACYTDEDGLLLGVFKSPKSAELYINGRFKKYKRQGNLPGFTQNGMETSMVWINESDNMMIHCPLYYPVFIEVEK